MASDKATINYRLQRMSEDLFIKYGSAERKYIDERVEVLIKGLKKYFGNEILDVKIFGSYKRDTILPRSFDKNSDIDVLVVFNQSSASYQPETYRTHLKKFAGKRYIKIRVVKDHPSIVMEMKGIMFDLVPCRIYERIFLSNYYEIPDKQGAWMRTEPDDFTSKLTRVNGEYNSIVKPIIRLMKRWNAVNDYPYAPFWLEQLIADMNFSNENYQTGFFFCVSKLSTDGFSQVNKTKIDQLRANRSELIQLLGKNEQAKAESLLRKMFKMKKTK